MTSFFQPLSFITEYWRNLSSISKKIVFTTGIYFGLTSFVAWSVGVMINNSYWCRPKLKVKRKFNGKTYAIVTGSNQGIGFEIAKDLMLSGCNVIMGCRNKKRANNAINNLLNISKDHLNHGKLLFIQIDLSSKKSVDTFIDKFISLNIECNILIHNACIVTQASSNIFTEDNMNIMWQVNYMSQFYLTLKLLPHIVNTSIKYKYGRIINVNSFAHNDSCSDDIEYFLDDVRRSNPLYIPDNNIKIHFNGVGCYASNKLGNIMFINKLYKYIQNKYKNTNKYLCVCCVHPGIVLTNNLKKDWKISSPLFFIQWYLFGLLSAKQGAINVLHAIHDDIDNNKYLVNGKYHTNGLYLKYTKKIKNLIDKYQDKLWNKSLEIWPLSIS